MGSGIAQLLVIGLLPVVMGSLLVAIGYWLALRRGLPAWPRSRP